MRRMLWAVPWLLPILAAAAANAEPVPMTPDRWELSGEGAFVERDGRQTVRLGPADGARLKSGSVTLRGASFGTGTIEFDILIDGERDFAGFVFRADESGNGELFYIRPHQNGNPDATQYTPVVNGSPAWQIFSGEGFTPAVRLSLNRWTHVRADIYAGSALISIDGAPALAAPHLKSSLRTGSVGLTAVGGAHFANVRVIAIDDYRDQDPAPPPPPLPPGTVAAWQVSPAMAEANALARAAARDWTGIGWHSVPAESNGIANLSLAGPDADGRHTYVARFMLRSRAARMATMDFGFSDSVRIFLDGRPVYAGADLQGSRDYRFLGIVGFWDTLFLPLEAGANEIVFVVTDETNGGTAAAARFASDPAVAIE